MASQKPQYYDRVGHTIQDLFPSIGEGVAPRKRFWNRSNTDKPTHRFFQALKQIQRPDGANLFDQKFPLNDQAINVIFGEFDKTRLAAAKAGLSLKSPTDELFSVIELYHELLVDVISVEAPDDVSQQQKDAINKDVVSDILMLGKGAVRYFSGMYAESEVIKLDDYRAFENLISELERYTKARSKLIYRVDKEAATSYKKWLRLQVEDIKRKTIDDGHRIFKRGLYQIQNSRARTEALTELRQALRLHRKFIDEKTLKRRLKKGEETVIGEGHLEKIRDLSRTLLTIDIEDSIERSQAVKAGNIVVLQHDNQLNSFVKQVEHIREQLYKSDLDMKTSHCLRVEPVGDDTGGEYDFAYVKFGESVGIVKGKDAASESENLEGKLLASEVGRLEREVADNLLMAVDAVFWIEELRDGEPNKYTFNLSPKALVHAEKNIKRAESFIQSFMASDPHHEDYSRQITEKRQMLYKMTLLYTAKDYKQGGFKRFTRGLAYSVRRIPLVGVLLQYVGLFTVSPLLYLSKKLLLDFPSYLVGKFVSEERKVKIDDFRHTIPTWHLSRLFFGKFRHLEVYKDLRRLRMSRAHHYFSSTYDNIEAQIAERYAPIFMSDTEDKPKALRDANEWLNYLIDGPTAKDPFEKCRDAADVFDFSSRLRHYPSALKQLPAEENDKIRERILKSYEPRDLQQELKDSLSGFQALFNKTSFQDFWYGRVKQYNWRGIWYGNFKRHNWYKTLKLHQKLLAKDKVIAAFIEYEVARFDSRNFTVEGSLSGSKPSPDPTLRNDSTLTTDEDYDRLIELRGLSFQRERRIPIMPIDLDSAFIDIPSLSSKTLDEVDADLAKVKYQMQHARYSTDTAKLFFTLDFVKRHPAKAWFHYKKSKWPFFSISEAFDEEAFSLLMAFKSYGLDCIEESPEAAPVDYLDNIIGHVELAVKNAQRLFDDGHRELDVFNAGLRAFYQKSFEHLSVLEGMGYRKTAPSAMHEIEKGINSWIEVRDLGVVTFDDYRTEALSAEEGPESLTPFERHHDEVAYKPTINLYKAMIAEEQEQQLNGLLTRMTNGLDKFFKYVFRGLIKIELKLEGEDSDARDEYLIAHNKRPLASYPALQRFRQRIAEHRVTGHKKYTVYRNDHHRLFHGDEITVTANHMVELREEIEYLLRYKTVREDVPKHWRKHLNFLKSPEELADIYSLPGDYEACLDRAIKEEVDATIEAMLALRKPVKPDYEKRERRRIKGVADKTAVFATINISLSEALLASYFFGLFLNAMAIGLTIIFLPAMLVAVALYYPRSKKVNRTWFFGTLFKDEDGREIPNTKKMISLGGLLFNAGAGFTSGVSTGFTAVKALTAAHGLFVSLFSTVIIKYAIGTVLGALLVGHPALASTIVGGLLVGFGFISLTSPVIPALVLTTTIITFSVLIAIATAVIFTQNFNYSWLDFLKHNRMTKIKNYLSENYLMRGWHHATYYERTVHVIKCVILTLSLATGGVFLAVMALIIAGAVKTSFGIKLFENIMALQPQVATGLAWSIMFVITGLNFFIFYLESCTAFASMATKFAFSMIEMAWHNVVRPVGTLVISPITAIKGIYKFFKNDFVDDKGTTYRQQLQITREEQLVNLVQHAWKAIDAARQGYNKPHRGLDFVASFFKRSVLFVAVAVNAMQGAGFNTKFALNVVQTIGYPASVSTPLSRGVMMSKSAFLNAGAVANMTASSAAVSSLAVSTEVLNTANTWLLDERLAVHKETQEVMKIRAYHFKERFGVVDTPETYSTVHEPLLAESTSRELLHKSLLFEQAGVTSTFTRTKYTATLSKETPRQYTFKIVRNALRDERHYETLDINRCVEIFMQYVHKEYGQCGEHFIIVDDAIEFTVHENTNKTENTIDIAIPIQRSDDSIELMCVRIHPDKKGYRVDLREAMPEDFEVMRNDPANNESVSLSIAKGLVAEGTKRRRRFTKPYANFSRVKSAVANNLVWRSKTIKDYVILPANFGRVGMAEEAPSEDVSVVNKTYSRHSYGFPVDDLSPTAFDRFLRDCTSFLRMLRNFFKRLRTPEETDLNKYAGDASRSTKKAIVKLWPTLGNDAQTADTIDFLPETLVERVKGQSMHLHTVLMEDGDIYVCVERRQGISDESRKQERVAYEKLNLSQIAKAFFKSRYEDILDVQGGSVGDLDGVINYKNVRRIKTTNKAGDVVFIVEFELANKSFALNLTPLGNHIHYSIQATIGEACESFEPISAVTIGDLVDAEHILAKQDETSLSYLADNTDEPQECRTLQMKLEDNTKPLDLSLVEEQRARLGLLVAEEEDSVDKAKEPVIETAYEKPVTRHRARVSNTLQYVGMFATSANDAKKPQVDLDIEGELQAAALSFPVTNN